MQSELRSCVKVEMDVPGSPFPIIMIVRTVSVDAKHIELESCRSGVVVLLLEKKLFVS